jgi:hypothetical protein
MVLYFYLYSASEHLGSLGALDTMQEVLVSPGVLLRSVLEHCAVSMWVLQRGDGALEDRLARAYLEELASAEEAKKTSGRLLERLPTSTRTRRLNSRRSEKRRNSSLARR